MARKVRESKGNATRPGYFGYHDARNARNRVMCQDQEQYRNLPYTCRSSDCLSAPERELEGLRIGADIYVVKPFNMRRLVMQCNNLINTRRLLQNKYAHQLDSKAEKIATNELDQKFIEQATQVVEDNMENPEFSVDAFSREMGVGRTVLFQKIKGITGSTPNNFIMNLRLKKAAYFLLNAPEMNISDIAYRLGFGNPQYFNKCFKELFDIAPTQYRKSHDAPSDPSVK